MFMFEALDVFVFVCSLAPGQITREPTRRNNGRLGGVWGRIPLSFTERAVQGRRRRASSTSCWSPALCPAFSSPCLVPTFLSNLASHPPMPSLSLRTLRILFRDGSSSSRWETTHCPKESIRYDPPVHVWEPASCLLQMLPQRTACRATSETDCCISLRMAMGRGRSSCTPEPWTSVLPVQEQSSQAAARPASAPGGAQHS